MKNWLKTFLLLGIAGFTLAVAVFAYTRLHSKVPGEQALAKSQWPVDSQLPIVKNRPRLVLFLHPLCPDADATVAEWQKILNTQSGKIDHFLVFSLFDDKKISKTKLWKIVTKIPGIHIIKDPSGFELTQFGAATSGQAYLYNEQGNLLFQGGIAASSWGMNKGSEQIFAYLQGKQVSFLKTDVFGSSLRDSSRSIAEIKDEK